MLLMENLLIVRTNENSIRFKSFLIECCKDKRVLESISVFTNVNSG
jgi:hypothetical protein